MREWGAQVMERDAWNFAEQAWSRNRGILTRAEQDALGRTRVLIAGCGSVGGSVVEPLVRMGVHALVLVDPDVYELDNINRQACVLSDLGRPKPEVLAERALAINPFIEVEAVTSGLNEQNLPELLADVTIVFDGVDVSPTSIRAKYLLHEQAATARLPVVSGADLGGKPTVFAFDYRRNPRPFYGRARAETFTPGRDAEAARALVRLRNIPRDFFPVIRHRLETHSPWPQVAYTAAALGALGSRVILEFATGRRVRHVISVDVHRLPKRRSRRLVDSVLWPIELVQTLNAIRRALREAA
jgi:ThiF family